MDVSALDGNIFGSYNSSLGRSHDEEEKMKFANVRELKNKTSEILRKAEKEDVVITSNGKPRAIISAMTEEDFEDYFLGKNSTFIKAREEAREEYFKNGGASGEKYLKTSKSKRR
jgi:antitoxin (DNA-binding transcriptional repressor) of toxin-antitoxin stability system